MYCTATDIEDAITRNTLAQLSNDYDSTQIDTTIVDNIIAKVSDEIDEYLRGRYSLPLSQTYTTLKAIAVDMSVYELYKRRRQVTDTINDLYDKAVQKLVDYQKGIRTLKQDEPGEGLIARSAQAKNNSRLRRFTDAFFKGFRI